VKLTIIGGPLHGQTREVPDGTAAWLDIERAETYPCRAITWAVAGTDGMPQELWRLPVAVWPGFTFGGPASELAQVNNALTQLAMTEYMRAHADAQQLEAAPNDPSALFGADGRPLPGGPHE
jgi:hypothetical protein